MDFRKRGARSISLWARALARARGVYQVWTGHVAGHVAPVAVAFEPGEKEGDSAFLVERRSPAVSLAEKQCYFSISAVPPSRVRVIVFSLAGGRKKEREKFVFPRCLPLAIAVISMLIYSREYLLYESIIHLMITFPLVLSTFRNYGSASFSRSLELEAEETSFQLRAAATVNPRNFSPHPCEGLLGRSGICAR